MTKIPLFSFLSKALIRVVFWIPWAWTRQLNSLGLFLHPTTFFCHFLTIFDIFEVFVIFTISPLSIGTFLAILDPFWTPFWTLFFDILLHAKNDPFLTLLPKSLRARSLLFPKNPIFDPFFCHYISRVFFGPFLTLFWPFLVVLGFLVVFGVFWGFKEFRVPGPEI